MDIVSELAATSEHTPQEIERVLRAFIDPENPRMELEQFLALLLEAALPPNEAGQRISHEQSVVDVLDRIAFEIGEARRFNDRYLGHMLSESSIPAFLAYILAMRIGSNTVAREVSINESDLESVVMHQLVQMVGFDIDQASGTFTSGGSLANMTALWAARERMPARRPTNMPYMRVLTTRFAHYSIDKACHILGGPDNAIHIERVDTVGYRMSPEDLERKIRKAQAENVPIMAIVAIAGETETGLVDPIEEIAAIAEKYDLWWMVDGTYGAPYRLSRVADKFRGMEEAFAVTLDPHKALYTPYSNGVVVFRNAADHAALARDIRADYLQFQEHDLPRLIQEFRFGEINLGQKRIEGSMGAGPILSTLAVLRSLGFGGLGVLYDLTLDRINFLYDRINRSKYLRPLHEPDLNLLCFTLRKSELDRLGIRDNKTLGNFINVARNILDKGTTGTTGYFFSATNLPRDQGGKHWVWRACIMHPRTTNQTLDQAITKLEEVIASPQRGSD